MNPEAEIMKFRVDGLQEAKGHLQLLVTCKVFIED